MKLGVANRIPVTDIDHEDTLDANPACMYSECVHLFQANRPECDSLAQAWLGHLNQDF